MKRALALITLIAVATSARADFSIDSQEGNGATPAPNAANETSKPASARRALKRPPPHTAPSKSSNVDAIAVGFGAQVPLAFAIRQIAPEGFEVVLEPPADPKALVDWRGGRPWTQALAEAVHPLGLTVTRRDNFVTISAAQ